jgi:hypothetical protein
VATELYGVRNQVDQNHLYTHRVEHEFRLVGELILENKFHAAVLSLVLQHVNAELNNIVN